MLHKGQPCWSSGERRIGKRRALNADAPGWPIGNSRTGGTRTELGARVLPVGGIRFNLTSGLEKCELMESGLKEREPLHENRISHDVAFGNT